MKKAIVQVGYNHFVLDTKKAIELLEILADAEIYEEKWRRQEDGGASHHVYPQDTEQGIRQLKMLPNAFYHMAKMAGKPQE